jgi:septum formation protein
MSLPILLLASNSPRRRQLLGLTGWTFTVKPGEVDETPQPGEHPGAYVTRLAADKARAAGSLASAGTLVIGADTTVADGNHILGKPADAAEARDMLSRLRGRVHHVYTARAIYEVGTGRLETDLCVTRVPMRDYSDLEMEEYVATGDPMDKAGAYAIQHPGFHPVAGLRGCYACVVGLPLCHLQRSMDKFGVLPFEDVPRACQAALSYECPVFSQILRGEDAGS